VLAPFYDIVALPLIRARDRVVKVANIKSGSKILDVSTGTGQQTFAFAKRGYEVIGIDISEAMLNVAHKHNKYSHTKLEVGDATDLPFGDSSFDPSTVSFALHDMPLTIREQVLREMVRVTKLSGTVIIVDYALPQNKARSFFIYRLIRLYEGPYYAAFIKSDLASLLRIAGVEISRELPILLGAGKIILGMKGSTAP
jgi:demethylmenaquinone methyltransferase/2-methoxy-6-polyprenyl-1,4-benzoquinol methylase